MLRADVMLADFRNSFSKYHKRTAAYSEVCDFCAPCDTHLVRAVFKQAFEARKWQLVPLYRQKGHQGSRVCGNKHIAQHVGHEIHYAAWPRPRHRPSSCKHNSLSVRPNFPPPTLMRKISVALLNDCSRPCARH